MRAYTLTTTAPVGIASVAPPWARLAVAPRSETVRVAAVAPGTKLLSGELTIVTGVTHVYWPPKHTVAIADRDRFARVDRHARDPHAWKLEPEPVHGEATLDDHALQRCEAPIGWSWSVFAPQAQHQRAQRERTSGQG